ncbi:MAG: hypothetical protein JWO83_2718 [Caulobacteraceae bacterium]|nr:hypothetical protein [Caulobacteraceae bacterium]
MLGTPAAAADVVSPAPARVAVTIYRDQPMRTAELTRLGDDDTHGLALVVEDREIDLPAGRSRLRFEGVADGIIPQSAGEEGLPAAIVERNFDYGLLTPGALIAGSVGETVQLVRTNRRTGREARRNAVIRSGPDGVVLETAGRFEALGCGGEAEKLVFDHVPAGLAARPTLSLAIDAPRAGHYKVRLSYLTVRMDWTADYIARLAPDGRNLALSGWITLANRTATAFENAPTGVVAGHLARVPVDIPVPQTPARDPHCWPAETTHGGWPVTESPVFAALGAAPTRPMAARSMASGMVVAAQKRAIESQLGDYKLYTLAEPTTVAARQTKQVLFLDQPVVKFETVYAHTVEPLGMTTAEPTPQAAEIVLRLENKAAQGLGRPLPAGTVQLRQPQAIAGGRELLLGEPALDRDVPVGEPFELRLGQASEVTLTERLTSDQLRPGHRVSRTFEVLAANAKAQPVTVEIRHDRAGADGFKVTAESTPHADKAGDPLWRLTLPTGAEQTLRYTVEFAR